MKIFSQELIKSLGISPVDCVEWVQESFKMKHNVQLPPKISLHPQGNDFFNTMPCILPEPYNYYCIKVVHRIAGAIPSLGGDIFLYDSLNGELLAMFDSDWITAMRTGAVAALAAKTFRKDNTETYGLFGLGNTGRATILCLLETEPEINHHIYLLKYKEQAETFINRFKSYNNVEFEIVNDPRILISKSDVVISCVTDATDLFCRDNEAFREGCLVIPVHTKGFQNCDLFFDKVYCDDRGHICGFKYFNQFKQLAEFSDVLNGNAKGRENDQERILSYNIGIGLHDAVFASKIYSVLKKRGEVVNILRETEKFWI